MSRVERTLEDVAAINREMQIVNREMQAVNHEMQAKRDAWEEARARRDEERAQMEHAAQARREAELLAFREEVRADRRKWGELANKMGTLVEDIVAPGIPTVFQTVFGRARIAVAMQHMRCGHATDPGREREFDYVVVAGNLVLITQTRRTVRPEDIPEFLAVLKEVRDYLPKYADKQFVGALAGFSLDRSLVVAGERQGLLMFGLGTGLLQVLNTLGFQPTRF